MKKRLIDLLFILLFLVLCLIPSLGMLVFGESEAAANEILASRPSARNRSCSPIIPIISRTVLLSVRRWSLPGRRSMQRSFPALWRSR